MRFAITITERIARYLVVLVAVCVQLLLGCSEGPSGPTVSGTITYNGQPVSGGLINFQPTAGQPLGGAINADGSYEFQLPAGEYQVRVETPPKLPEGWKEGDPDPQLEPSQVPLKYAQFGSSDLKATVKPGGPQRIDFELE